MGVKQVFEALLESDFFSQPSQDARARVLLREQANQCVRILRALGFSREGAIHEVRRVLRLDPLRHCTTPVEQQMMAAFIGVDWRPFLTIPPTVHQPGKKSIWLGDLIIAPQYNFGPYCLDFLIIGKDDLGNQKWLNVECDGEAYHHANMEQKDRDRERNKYMRGCGVEVIRFGGDEIFREAAACAHEASAILIDWRQKQPRGRSGRDCTIEFNFDPPQRR